MINLAKINVQKLTFMCTLLMSTLLLYGCGGEREFSSSGSTSSNSGIELNVQLLANASKIEGTGGVNDNQKFDTMDDENSYLALWQQYTNRAPQSIDFAKGQVVLYDSGTRNVCDPQFTVKNVKAYEDGTVIFYLTNRKASSSSLSSNSSSNSNSESSSSQVSSSANSSSSSICDTQATPNHPFAFYYIPTRVPLFVRFE